MATMRSVFNVLSQTVLAGLAGATAYHPGTPEWKLWAAILIVATANVLGIVRGMSREKEGGRMA